MTSSPEGRQEAAVALLPCPFCGGSASERSNRDVGNAWVSCDACLAQSGGFQDSTKPPHLLREIAAEEWNRRALPAPVAAAPVGVSDAMVETVAAKFMASQHGVDLLGYPEGTYRDGIMYSMRAALEAALIAPAKPAVAQSDEVVVIDLDAWFWQSIKDAAKASSWIPKNQYYMNDWVSDVCDFLREGPPAKPAVELVEALQRLRAVGADCARHNNEKAQADIEECCGDIEAALQAPATPDAQTEVEK